MLKIILSILFFIISVSSFVYYVKPTYARISADKQMIARNEASLQKANLVQRKINELIDKRKEMNKDALNRLAKLVPANNVDNIQLILDIEGITKQYDMKLQKVNISKTAEKKKRDNPGQPRINVGVKSDDYLKSLTLSFEVVSSYDEFIKFIIDLEHSLRIVDIVDIQVSPKKEQDRASVFESGLLEEFDDNASTTDINIVDAPKYTFSVVIRTYWINVN